MVPRSPYSFLRDTQHHREVYDLMNTLHAEDFVVVTQSLSRVQLFETPWIAVRQISLSFTISQSLLKLMSIESVMPSNHLILCHSLLLLTSILPSIRIFCNESALCIRWPKYWSFSFSISPSNEYAGLISYRIDWFDLLVVQETLKSLLKHHCSKVSVLHIRWPKYWSFSFGISPSNEYSGVSRFVITFLARSH